MHKSLLCTSNIWNWLFNDAPLNIHFLLEMKSTWQKSERWIHIICGGGEGIWNDRGWSLTGEGGGDKNPLRLLKETIFLLLLMFRPSELLSLRTVFIGSSLLSDTCHKLFLPPFRAKDRSYKVRNYIS